jgi:hypothetical protein
VPADLVADFLATEHGGAAAGWRRRIAAGDFCPTTTIAGVAADGRLTGVALNRFDGNSYFCELLVAARDRRPGPTPLFLLDESCRRAVAPDRPVVFEADESHNPFTWQFATRCGAERRHTRFQYTAGPGVGRWAVADRFVGFAPGEPLGGS